MSVDYLQRLPAHLRKTGDVSKGEIQLLPSYADGNFGIIFEDPYVVIIRDRVLFPDGREGGYLRIMNQAEVAGSPGAVMVPIWNKAVIFIRIFRHTTREWEWELPRGYHEAGITEQQSAQKEVLEELGVAGAAVWRIGGINPNTGLLTGLLGVYAVELAADPCTAGRPDAQESISGFRSVPISELVDFISKNQVRCGISLAALFLYMSATQASKPS